MIREAFVYLYHTVTMIYTILLDVMISTTTYYYIHIQTIQTVWDGIGPLLPAERQLSFVCM